MIIGSGVDVIEISRIERVLTGDPATGVMRHADAGYQRAVDIAHERGVRIPGLE